MIRLLTLMVLILAAPAAAQDTCTESFPARLADAKQALIDFDSHQRAYEKARPAIEWFEAHCRFLDELEIAVRKLDDPNAFVCDPKRRPKGLTSELVLQFSAEPSIGAYQKFHGENHRCEERDRAERVSLVLIVPDAQAHVVHRLESVLHQSEVMCWGDDRPSCVKSRADIAEQRAAIAEARRAGKVGM